jgi:excisionase family DNA binding protein
MAKQIMYRVGQAGKDLGVSSYRIRRLCETGRIDAEFTGKQWQIPAAEVERLKRDGVPPAPKIVDPDDVETSRGPNAKENGAPTLLGDPSPEMIAAAEEAEMSGRQLTVAKNKLEQNRVRREEIEIEDFLAERTKRLQQQEEEDRRHYQKELEADARKREESAAAERRREFYSKWLEHALQEKPYGAPNEVELDIHQEVIAALGKVDTNERDCVVRRLVDAAVERSLKPWKTGETRRAAIEDALSQMPYHMKCDQSWKEKATKTASEALADVRPGVSKEEMVSLARAALQPLMVEFKRDQDVDEAVNSVRIDGANHDELCDARESVREALDALPKNTTARQIAQTKEQTLAPISARVAERIAREEAQRRREQMLSSVFWNLPREISDDDEKTAIAEITEALNDLPADASERDVEKARDEIVQEYEEIYREKAKRAAKKAAHAEQKSHLIQVGLNAIRPYAERMLREFDYDRGETAWSIDARVRGEVRKTLEEELTGRETEQEVGRMVRRAMSEIEDCG